MTALAPGSATISASSEGRSGSATLVLSLTPVANVSVSLANVRLLAGATAQASALLRDEIPAQNAVRWITVTVGLGN